jgi:hypothetical protein
MSFTDTMAMGESANSRFDFAGQQTRLSKPGLRPVLLVSSEVICPSGAR